MKKTTIFFFVFLALSIISYVVFQGDISEEAVGYTGLSVIVSPLLTACFGFSWILQKIFKNKSAYSMFAVADLICIAIVLIIAFSDILKDSSGELSGIFGGLLIALIVPLQLIILIGDLILWGVVYIIKKNTADKY